MIIKIKSHKQPAYGRILNYILHDTDRLFDEDGRSFLYTQNLIGTDVRSWIMELQQLQEKRKRTRKNQIYYTHEILSWHRDSTKDMTLEKMRDITREYVRLRGGNRAVVLAAPHMDKEHYHVHLYVHATDLAGDTMRMTREEFARVKEQAQEYYLARYPELARSAVEHGRKKSARNRDKEKHLSRRTGKESKRERIADIVAQCRERSSSQVEFDELLKEQGIQPYVRSGKACGITYEGRKYRYKTLGAHVQAAIERGAERDRQRRDLVIKREKRRERQMQRQKGRELDARGR